MSNCPALITRSLWPSPVMKTTEALKSGCIISTIKMLVFVSEWSTLICTVLDHDKEPLTITSDGDKALKRGCIICWIKMLPQHRPQTVSPSTVMKAEHSSVPAQLVATQVYFPSWFILALLIFSLTFSSSCHVFMLGDRTSSRPFLNSEPRNNTAAWWVYACTANHHSQQPFFSDWEWARSLWAWCFEAYWCCLYKRAKYNIATPNFHARNAVIILYQTCCYLCHWMAKPRKNDGANCRITWRRDKTEERKRNKTEERPVNVNGWTWRMWRWVLITLSPKSASKHFEVLRKSWWMNLSRKRKAKKKTWEVTWSSLINPHFPAPSCDVLTTAESNAKAWKTYTSQVTSGRGSPVTLHVNCSDRSSITVCTQAYRNLNCPCGSQPRKVTKKYPYFSICSTSSDCI